MSRYLYILFLLSFHFIFFGQSVVSVVPDEARQGEELEVTVTGANTSWSQSTHLLMFTQGSTTIYAYPQTVISDTLISGDFYFEFYHPTGLYDVVVEDIDGETDDILDDGFTLNEGDEPVIKSVEPDSSQQVEYLTITVTGEHTQFTQGSSVLMLQGDFIPIYPSSQYVYSDTMIEGDFFINIDHIPGLYDVKVFSDAPTVILKDGFTVLPVENTPELISVEPNSALQGETVMLNVTGQHTHFDYPGLEFEARLDKIDEIIYADNISIIDSSLLEIWFTFDYTHAPGVYDLIVFEQLDGTLLLDESFNLLQGSGGPQIVSVEPDDAEQEQSLWVTITGQHTEFTTGTALIKFKQGSSTIFPTGQNVLNDTVIEGDFNFTIEDKEGYYDVVVFDYNGNWSVEKENGFYLYPYVFVEEFREATIGRVYPNPATQLLFIKRNPSTTSGIAIDILNMAGEIIYLDEMTENQQVKSINVTNIDPGVYLIHLKSANGVYSEKIVIK